jgi:hypothetical protein
MICRPHLLGHCLVGVDASVGLLAAKVVLEELLDLGDPGAATDEHDMSISAGAQQIDMSISFIDRVHVLNANIGLVLAYIRSLLPT